jgi:hypothetical protein
MTDENALPHYEMVKHAMLAVALSVVLLFQVVMLETVAPGEAQALAEHGLVGIGSIIVYGMLPQLRYVGRRLFNRTSNVGGGEAA